MSRRVPGTTRVACVLACLLAVGTASRAERIACTEAALNAKIAALNENCSGDKTITFDCSNTTIGIRGDANGGDRYLREIRCDGVTIDGESNNITFQLDPVCGDIDGEGGEWLFLVKGDDVTIRNITYTDFWEGIWAGPASNSSTRNTLVENTTCDMACDDCFTPQAGTTGTIYRDNTLRRGRDKCIQVKGRDIGSTSFPDYDAQILNNTFESCAFPVFGNADGRFLIQGNQFLNLIGSGTYDCDGPKFGANKPNSNTAVYFIDNVVNGCRQGVMIEGSTHFYSDLNTYENNEVRGVYCDVNARCLFQNDLFGGNGGLSSGTVKYGGLHVAGNAVADAGGGSISLDGRTLSSAGANVFLGNASPSDATLDLQNATSSMLKAELNFWGDTNPSDQVDGPVDFDPVQGEGPPTGPLLAPPTVWRTDAH